MIILSKNPYEQFPHIISDEITLRKIVASDLDSLFEIYNNEKLFQYSPLMLKKNKRNDFVKEGIIRQGYVWKGQGVVDLILYSLLKFDTIK